MISRRHMVKQIAGLGTASLLPSPFAFQKQQDAPASRSSTPLEWSDDGRAHITAALTDNTGKRRDLPFLFDTAASITVMHRLSSYALDLDQVVRRQRQIFSANGAVQSLIYQVPEFEVFGQRYQGLEMPAVPHAGKLSSFGLIGTDMMAGRRLLMDFKAAQIRQLPQNADLPKGFVTLDSLPVLRQSFTLSLIIKGIDIPAVIDTGATNTVINLPVLEALKDRGSPLYGRDGGKISAGGREVDAVAYDVKELALGGRRKPWQRISVGDATIYMAPIDVFRRLGAGKVPAAIVGMDLLTRQNILFDFKNRKLSLAGSLMPEPDTE